MCDYLKIKDFVYLLQQVLSHFHCTFCGFKENYEGDAAEAELKVGNMEQRT